MQPQSLPDIPVVGESVQVMPDQWRMLWVGRKWIALGAVIGALAGITYAYLVTPIYRADVVVMVAEQKTASPALSQLGGLASLAGLSVGSANSVEPLAVLRSRDFARRFIDEHKLARRIMSARATVLGAPVVEDDSGPMPDVRDAIKRFDQQIRTVGEDKKTGLITLSIRWSDPVLAADWANEQIARVNAEMRQRAEEESVRNREYLQEQMNATGIVTLQQAIGRLLETEMQKLMLAKGSTEYAFRIIDPATPPKHWESPNRAMVSVVGLLAGALMAALAVAGGLFGRKAGDVRGGS